MSDSSPVRHDLSFAEGCRWLDVDLAHEGVDALLAEIVPGWEQLRSNFLSDGAPVGYLEHEQGLYLAFRGADLNAGGTPEDLVAVRAWSDAKTIVTASRRTTRSVDDLVTRIAQGQHPADAPSLMFGLAKRLAFHIAPLQKEFEAALDKLEDELLAGHEMERAHTDSELAQLRRTVLILRRRVLSVRRGVLPQIELLDDLEEDQPAPVSEEVHEHLLQEARQRFSRHLEDLDGKRDRTILLAEEIAGLQEERTNRRTYVFTVVAGVFLPLGFVTGLLGINVGGMPGADDPMAFWWVTLGLTALGIALWVRLRSTR